MILTSYSPADYRVTQWKNGAGETLELLQELAPDSNGFLWRISIADVKASGFFSDYPGIDRQFMLIDGRGMVLDFGGAAPAVAITKPLQPYSFMGEWKTECHLTKGPVKDFNLMVRRDWGSGKLMGFTMARGQRISLSAAPLTIVHVLSGRIECQDRIFDAGATLKLESDDPRRFGIVPMMDPTSIASAALTTKPAPSAG